MRFVTPYAYFWKNLSPGLEIENHNKYWVGMHLGHPQGKELFLELVKKSDVVADNLTPGRMAEWGLKWSELKEVNPRIIQLHVSGYGSWGPWTGRTSYDAVAQSMGALSPITGFEDRGPIKLGVWIADWITGLMCSVAIMAALNYRERTGEGQFIDYMQVENVIRWLDWTWLHAFKTGEDRKRSGNRDLAICPSDLFECQDGWVAVAAFSNSVSRASAKPWASWTFTTGLPTPPNGLRKRRAWSTPSPAGPRPRRWRRWRKWETDTVSPPPGCWTPRKPIREALPGAWRHPGIRRPPLWPDEAGVLSPENERDPQPGEMEQPSGGVR